MATRLPCSPTKGNKTLALLNPPESRPTLILLIARRLADRPDASENKVNLIKVLAAHGSGGRNPTRDVEVNLAQSTMLGITAEDGEVVRLSAAGQDALQSGNFTKFLREQVMDKRHNSEPWGSQAGARDLTNGLAWFLALPIIELPTDFAGRGVNAQAIQARQFGERRDGPDGENNWPIVNSERWGPFQRWACGLGLAWTTPKGLTVPDPTAALRDVIPEAFKEEDRISAKDFTRAVAEEIPVLDGGTYRKFVEANLADEQSLGSRGQFSQAFTDALRRLELAGEITLEQRDDAPTSHDANKRPFTHVSTGGRR